MYLLRCCITHASRTQATVALSSGEAELYAIGSGIIESIFVKNSSQEACVCRQAHLIIKTDPTAGKSLAMGFGTSQKTRHIDLQF